MNTETLPAHLHPVNHALGALVRMKDGDMTTRQFCILLLLAESHPKHWCTGELTKETGLMAPVVTRAILRLEEDGLVINGRSRTDRRRNAVHLSKKGLYFIHKLGEGAAKAPHQPENPS
jgi:DNA-binding MarR family transcriptional regulator